MTEQPSVLKRILAHKQHEVQEQQHTQPIEQLKAKLETAPPVRDFAAALSKGNKPALIAEVKKASPSRGVLMPNFDHMLLAETYMQHGAAALSVLTDIAFFQGHLTYIQQIRQAQTKHQIPLLRKDFLLDPYQVYQSRVFGADAVLLIVAALDDVMLRKLLALTEKLGMHALVEVHTEGELERALAIGAKIVGVNNRDLHTFTTHLETTEHLATLLPTGTQRPLLVSESGIDTPADVVRLRSCGVDAILVGESLVTSSSIGAKVREFVEA